MTISSSTVAPSTKTRHSVDWSQHGVYAVCSASIVVVKDVCSEYWSITVSVTHVCALWHSPGGMGACGGGGWFGGGGGWFGGGRKGLGGGYIGAGLGGGYVGERLGGGYVGEGLGVGYVGKGLGGTHGITSTSEIKQSSSSQQD